MSDERYVKITREQRDSDVDWSLGTTPDAICEAFDAAEGQRVESIRWCTTHGYPAYDPDDPDRCSEHTFGFGAPCVIVEASLILPSEASS